MPRDAAPSRVEDPVNALEARLLGMRDSAARSETRSRSREWEVVQSQGCGFSLFWSCSDLLSAAKRVDQRSAGGAYFRF
jgi:hypothetical protein